MKKCSKCPEVKPLSEFVRSSRYKSGYAAICLVCNRKRHKVYHAANPQMAAKRTKLWSKQNPDMNSAKSVRWAKKNPGKKNAITAKRNAAKLERTPKWLTKDQLNQIQEFYIIAKEIQWLSEESLEVDHIIPLQGELISGLHVPWNLQILPVSVNISKGNRL